MACAARGAWPLVGFFRHRERARAAVRRCGAGQVVRADLFCNDFGIGSELPDVDALVHCAGMITDQRNLLGSSDEELWRLLTVNAIGPLRLTRELLLRTDSLRHIVFMLSTAIACRGSGAYAVSKTAALAMAKLLAKELGARGVRVDAVVPGWTDTEMARFAARSMGHDLDHIRRKHPGREILRPEQLADLCADLLLGNNVPAAPQLILWDKRLGDKPIWRDLETVLPFDEVPSR
jgi:NAD(P)-dependent dehydrogenase (short-subunit alcohol dehydrogenase family)